MSLDKKQNLFKMVWYSLLLLTGLFLGGTIYFFKVGTLTSVDLYLSVGVVGFIVVILLFYKNKNDAQTTILEAQDNYVHDEAINSLYERSPVGYLTINTQGKIIANNPASVNLLRGKADKIIGVNFFQLLKSDAETDVNILESKVVAGQTINDTEVAIKTFSGDVVWVMLSIFVYRNNRQRLVSLVDITEQKNIDTAKSEFVALATHQLRTPISAIRWNTELLQKNMQDKMTDDQARYLTKIDRNVLRMINLINDFLSVSKLEMGTFATKSEKINLADFFTNVVTEFSEKITEKEIIISQKGRPVQLIIETDNRLLHIIISNLVSNAVKYSRTKGTLSLSYEVRSNWVEIVVADNGIGIPVAELDKLFTKFYRASNAQSHQTEGTGLGLYVVKQSAELLGGSVAVESDEDEGAWFVVRLPVV